MADISIPKLNRLDANTVANTDVLLIVDDPQGNPENKKIQVGELFSGSQSELQAILVQPQQHYQIFDH